MQITSIDLFHVAVPFTKPYKLSKIYGVRTHAEAVVVRLETDRGLVGWGEADPSPPFTEETAGGVLAALEGHLAPLLLGADPLMINRHLADMEACLSGNLAAKAAVDMALQDLSGKHHGLPVAALLGGACREDLPVLWPLGSGSVEDDQAVIETKRGEGYRTFMVKMGASEATSDAQRLRQLLDRYATDLKLIPDANQGWRESEAVAFVEALRGQPVTLLEQPVSAGNMEGLARVRQMATFPVSADESLTGAEQALALIANRAADVFSIKVSKNGGIAAARRITGIAAAAGVDCLMNSMLEFGITQAASLQLGMATANLFDAGHAYMSVLRMSDDFTDFGRLVRDGRVRLDSRPGLGVEIDESKLRRYAVQHRRLDRRRTEDVAS